MPTARDSLRYDRETPEFSRVANLSDAVFAIAMTLLVLTLDTPAGGSGLATALVDQLPQLMVSIMLVMLGAVALVPFPTRRLLYGSDGPTRLPQDHGE